MQTVGKTRHGLVRPSYPKGGLILAKRVLSLIEAVVLIVLLVPVLVVLYPIYWINKKVFG